MKGAVILGAVGVALFFFLGLAIGSPRLELLPLLSVILGGSLVFGLTLHPVKMSLWYKAPLIVVILLGITLSCVGFLIIFGQWLRSQI